MQQNRNRHTKLPPQLLIKLLPVVPAILLHLRDRDLAQASTTFQKTAISLLASFFPILSPALPGLNNNDNNGLMTSNKYFNQTQQQTTPMLLPLATVDMEDDSNSPDLLPSPLIDTDFLIEQTISILASALDVGALANARKRRQRADGKLPSTKELRLIFLSTDVSILYHVVLRILIFSQPGLFPPPGDKKGLVTLARGSNFAANTNGGSMAGASTFEYPADNPRSRLNRSNVSTAVSPSFATSSVADNKVNLKQDIMRFRKWLEDYVSAETYVTFGEFCSLIRDSMALNSSQKLNVSVKTFSVSLGKVLFSNTSEKLGYEFQSNLSSALEFFINNCYSIFETLPEKNNNWKVNGNRGTALPNDKLLKFDKLKQDLVAFYESKDSQLAFIVPKLFQSYTIYQLALGVLMRYQCLPLGWKPELDEAKQRGVPSIVEWYAEEKITFISDTMSTRAAAKSVRYPNYVPSGAKRQYAAMVDAAKTDVVNNVIKELYDYKRDFVESLSQFLHEYVSEIKFIAKSQSFSKTAKEALGISEEQISYAMESSLRKVANVERDVLRHLEVLSLLPCDVQQNYGRVGIVCKVMGKFCETMTQVYTEYHANYEPSMQLVNQLRTAVMQKQQAVANAALNNSPGPADRTELAPFNLGAPSTMVSKRDMSFVKMFEEISQNNRNLQKGLDTILGSPVGSISKLPLFFKRIKEEMEKSNRQGEPVYALLCQTVAMLQNMLERINQGLADSQQTNKKKGAKSPGLFRLRSSSTG